MSTSNYMKRRKHQQANVRTKYKKKNFTRPIPPKAESFAQRSQIKGDGKRNIKGAYGTKLKVNKRGSLRITKGAPTTTTAIFSITRKPEVGIAADFKVEVKLSGTNTQLDQQNPDKISAEDETFENQLAQKGFGVEWRFKIREAILSKIKLAKKPLISDKGSIQEYLKKNKIKMEVKIEKKTIGKFKITAVNKKIELPPRFHPEAMADDLPFVHNMVVEEEREAQSEEEFSEEESEAQLTACEILGESLFLGLKF